MEHLNKVCKECTRDLGPNKTVSSIQQVARCIGTIDAVMTTFDSENGIISQHGKRKTVTCTSVVKITSEDLMKYQVIAPHQAKRAHPSFKTPKNLFST
jgi:hypothetical protein